jgi:hypothetical protein
MTAAGAYGGVAYNDFTGRCHVCGVLTEYVGGQRSDDRCGHRAGVEYDEAEYARVRVQRFLDTWLSHPTTSPQIAAVYTGRPKGEGDRHPLLVRDLSLVLEALASGDSSAPGGT